MMRFMDYLNIMFTEVHNDRNMKISDACSKAYRTALYPYHTYIFDTPITTVSWCRVQPSWLWWLLQIGSGC